MPKSRSLTIQYPQTQTLIQLDIAFFQAVHVLWENFASDLHARLLQRTYIGDLDRETYLLVATTSFMTPDEVEENLVGYTLYHMTADNQMIMLGNIVLAGLLRN